MQNNTKEFKQLQKEWYQKLKDSGFEDCERDEKYIKSPASHKLFREKRNGEYYDDKKVYYQAKQEYYRLAGHFLHDHTFKDDIEKMVWEYHSEGVGCRVMPRLLKEKGIKMNKDSVNKTIRSLKKLMLEMYKDKNNGV